MFLREEKDTPIIFHNPGKAKTIESQSLGQSQLALLQVENTRNKGYTMQDVLTLLPQCQSFFSLPKERRKAALVLCNKKLCDDISIPNDSTNLYHANGNASNSVFVQIKGAEVEIYNSAVGDACAFFILFNGKTWEITQLHPEHKILAQQENEHVLTIRFLTGMNNFSAYELTTRRDNRLPAADTQGMGMSRAIGDFMMGPYGLSSTSEISHHEIQLSDNPAFILVTSDGLFEGSHLPPTNVEILATFLKKCSATEAQDPKVFSEKLQTLAVQSRDDRSIALVALKKEADKVSTFAIGVRDGHGKLGDKAALGDAQKFAPCLTDSVRKVEGCGDEEVQAILFQHLIQNQDLKGIMSSTYLTKDNIDRQYFEHQGIRYSLIDFALATRSVEFIGYVVNMGIKFEPSKVLRVAMRIEDEKVVKYLVTELKINSDELDGEEKAKLAKFATPTPKPTPTPTPLPSRANMTAWVQQQLQPDPSDFDNDDSAFAFGELKVDSHEPTETLFDSVSEADVSSLVDAWYYEFRLKSDAKHKEINNEWAKLFGKYMSAFKDCNGFKSIIKQCLILGNEHDISPKNFLNIKPEYQNKLFKDLIEQLGTQITQKNDLLNEKRFIFLQRDIAALIPKEQSLSSAPKPTSKAPRP